MISCLKIVNQIFEVRLMIKTEYTICLNKRLLVWLINLLFITKTVMVKNKVYNFQYRNIIITKPVESHVTKTQNSIIPY